MATSPEFRRVLVVSLPLPPPPDDVDKVRRRPSYCGLGQRTLPTREGLESPYLRHRPTSTKFDVVPHFAGWVNALCQLGRGSTPLPPPPDDVDKVRRRPSVLRVASTHSA